MEKHAIYNMVASYPILETERLLLRRMKPSDWLDMFEYASNEKVTQYLTWYPHKTPEQTRDYLQRLQNHYKDGTFHDWALILKGKNKMIGSCGFTTIDQFNHCAEIGYVLNPAYWGQELAVEAAKCVMRYGFEKLDIHRMEARHLLGNIQSARVMEKCGMQKEGILREAMVIKDEFRSVCLWSVLREEFVF